MPFNPNHEMLERMIRYICLLFFCGLICFNPAVMAEQRPYDVIETYGEIEIRQYPTIMAASVIEEGDRKDAASAAFRTLFNYISGENATGEKIDMTAPVSQQKKEDNRWEVWFFMPTHFTQLKLPQPINQRVRIRELESTAMATITFSGRGRNANLLKHETILRRFLEKKSISFTGDAIYSFYDPPFMPWFLRRNEVAFTVDLP